MYNAIEKHADELLKQEYYSAAAWSCGNVIILFLIWILWGRWFDDIVGPSGTNIVGNLAITVAPYLTILSIYTTVRKKMKTLSGDGA